MVCLNHPDTEAVTKCEACGKPLCSQCALPCDGHYYCSQSCCDRGRAAAARSGSVIAKKSGTDRKLAWRKLLIVIVLLAAAAAGAYFYFQHRDEIDRQANRSLRQIQSKSGSLIEDTKSAIPTSSGYKRQREGLVNSAE